MGFEVRRVNSKRDLRAFIELPFRLYRDEPNWVAPLRFERRQFLDRGRNPFFEHGRAEYYLGVRDGRVIGRITAQFDDAFNRYHDNRWGMFGWLEFEDDPEVVPALLKAASAWLRQHGRDHMIGPMDFTMNDESGVLIEGFDREPFVKQPWHPPYYARRLEEVGMAKAMDLFMWELEISDREKMRPILFELAADVEPKHGVKLRRMSFWHLRREMDRFADVYNSAWADNWDFRPYSKADLDMLAQELWLVFDKPWFMVAERDDETVAVAITIPDINQVLRKMNGRLLPLGWWHFLRKGKIIDRVRVGFLGVKPEFQHTGVAAKMYVEHFDMARIRPQTWGEMGWILETNKNMNRAMEAMGGRIVRRFRVYERTIASA